EPLNQNCHIKDCIIRGDAGGGWVQGDGINLGWCKFLRVGGNRIQGTKRHAYEGGGQSRYQWFEGNFVDMAASSGTGINPTDGRQISVINNKMINHTSAAIGFMLDIGYFVQQDLDVVGNYINGAGTAVGIASTSGGADAIRRVRILN